MIMLRISTSSKDSPYLRQHTYIHLSDVTISYAETTFCSYSAYNIPVHSPYIWLEPVLNQFTLVPVIWILYCKMF